MLLYIICDGARARPAKFCHAAAIFCQPTIGSLTASALAAAPLYMFTMVLITPFFSSP